MADPIVKWVGGKRQLVPELLKYLPKTLGQYYEPFVGGAALFFALEQGKGDLGRRAHLNDANPDLINVYTQVRDNVEGVISVLGDLDNRCRVEGMKTAYDHTRDNFNLCNSDPRTYPAGFDRRAAYFIALNAWGFNGLCRYNKKGGFNVPCGKFAKTPVLMDKADNLRAASQALQGVEITCGSYERGVADAKAGDLVYFDPPYVPASATSDFTSYTSDGFGAEDQKRLRNAAVGLVGQGVHVILSNSDTPATRELYQSQFGFTLHEVQARRAVNSKADKRGKVGELIIVGRP